VLGGACSAPRDPLAGFTDDLLLRKGGEEGRDGRAREGRREGRGPTYKARGGRKGEGGLDPKPKNQNFTRGRGSDGRTDLAIPKCSLGRAGHANNNENLCDD